MDNNGSPKTANDRLRNQLTQTQLEATHWSDMWTRLRRQYDELSQRHHHLQRVIDLQRPIIDELLALTTTMITEHEDDEAIEQLDAGVKQLFTMNYRDDHQRLSATVKPELPTKLAQLEADNKSLEAQRLRLFRAYMSLYRDYQRIIDKPSGNGFNRDQVLQLLINLIHRNNPIAEVKSFLQSTATNGGLTTTEVEELNQVLSQHPAPKEEAMSALDLLPDSVESSSTRHNSYIDGKDSMDTVFADNDDHGSDHNKLEIEALTTELERLKHDHAEWDHQRQQWQTSTEALKTENAELRHQLQQLQQLQLQQHPHHHDAQPQTTTNGYVPSDHALRTEIARLKLNVQLLWQENQHLVAQLTAPFALDKALALAPAPAPADSDAIADLARLERHQRHLHSAAFRHQRTVARAVAIISMDMLRHGDNYDPQRPRAPITLRTVALLALAVGRLRRQGQRRRRAENDIAAVDAAVARQRRRVALITSLAKANDV